MNSYDQHTLDEYLLNRLNTSERQSFEQSLANNEALKTELEERKQLIAALDMMGDVQMKHRVKKIHQAELGNRAEKPKGTNHWKWAIAFLLFLIASLGIWMVVRPKPQTPTQLYATYYKPYDLSFGSRNTDSDKVLAEAGNLYKAGKFAEALPLFEQIVSTNPQETKADLALGICYLELKKNDQALTQFSKLTADPLFGEQALWYSAMTKLQQDRDKEAKGLLEKMLVEYPDAIFAEDAARVLNELKN